VLSLWQGSFSEADFDRMAYIRRVHGHGADAEAIRFAVREQAVRSALPVTPILTPLYAAAISSCVEMKGRWVRANVSPSTQAAALAANAGRKKLRRWSFRTDETDLERMDIIKERHGLSKRAEAVRFAIHVQAALDGYRPKRRQQ